MKRDLRTEALNNLGDVLSYAVSANREAQKTATEQERKRLEFYLEKIRRAEDLLAELRGEC